MNSPVQGFLRKDISSSRAKWFFAAGPNGSGDLHLLKFISIMDKYLIRGWQHKQIFHTYWNDMDVEDQIDKASDDKELDYGLFKDSSWGLLEHTGLSFMGMNPPMTTTTNQKTPSK